MRRNKGDTRASVNKLALTKVGINVRDWLTLSALFFSGTLEPRAGDKARETKTYKLDGKQMSLTGRVLPAGNFDCCVRRLYRFPTGLG